jgi:hypothetical protein
MGGVTSVNNGTIIGAIPAELRTPPKQRFYDSVPKPIVNLDA